MRSMGRSDGLGLGVWLAIGVAVLVVGGGIALAVVGSAVKPVQHEVEQVISNDRFPS